MRWFAVLIAAVALIAVPAYAQRHIVEAIDADSAPQGVCSTAGTDCQLDAACPTGETCIMDECRSSSQKVKIVTETGNEFFCDSSSTPNRWKLRQAVASPGGDDTEAQFNDGGILGGTDSMLMNDTTKRVKFRKSPWYDVTHPAWMGSGTPGGDGYCSIDTGSVCNETTDCSAQWYCEDDTTTCSLGVAEWDRAGGAGTCSGTGANCYDLGPCGLTCSDGTTACTTDANCTGIGDELCDDTQTCDGDECSGVGGRCFQQECFTPDQFAFTAAVDAACADGGGTIYFPDIGTPYLMDGGYAFMCPNLDLVCEPGAVLMQTANARKWSRLLNYSGDNYDADETPAPADSGYEPNLLSGCILDGNQENRGDYDAGEQGQSHLLFAGTAADYEHQMYLNVENTTFRNSAGGCLEYRGNVIAKVSNLNFHSCWRDGLAIIGYNTHVYGSGLRFTGPYGRAFDFEPDGVQVGPHNDSYWANLSDIYADANFDVGSIGHGVTNFSNVTIVGNWGTHMKSYGSGSFNLSNFDIQIGSDAANMVFPSDVNISNGVFRVAKPWNDATEYAGLQFQWSSGANAPEDQVARLTNVTFVPHDTMLATDLVSAVDSFGQSTARGNKIIFDSVKFAPGFDYGVRWDYGGTYEFNDVTCESDTCIHLEARQSVGYNLRISGGVWEPQALCTVDGTTECSVDADCPSGTCPAYLFEMLDSPEPGGVIWTDFSLDGDLYGKINATDQALSAAEWHGGRKIEFDAAAPSGICLPGDEAEFGDIKYECLESRVWSIRDDPTLMTYDPTTETVSIPRVEQRQAAWGSVAVVVESGKFYLRLDPDTINETTINYVELDGNTNYKVNFTTCDADLGQVVPTGYDGYDCGETYSAGRGWGWTNSTAQNRERSNGTCKDECEDDDGCQPGETCNGNYCTGSTPLGCDSDDDCTTGDETCYGEDTPTRESGLIYRSTDANTWEMDVENGGYTVTISAGDLHYAQGPHFIDVSDDNVSWIPIIDNVATAVGVFEVVTLEGPSTRCISREGTGELFVDANCDEVKDAGENYLGGGGAPADATYWTSTADGDLSAEVVVDDLASLNTALGTSIADGAHIPDTFVAHSGLNDELFTSDGGDGVVAETNLTFGGSGSASHVLAIGETSHDGALGINSIPTTEGGLYFNRDGGPTADPFFVWLRDGIPGIHMRYVANDGVCDDDATIACDDDTPCGTFCDKTLASNRRLELATDESGSSGSVPLTVYQGADPAGVYADTAVVVRDCLGVGSLSRSGADGWLCGDGTGLFIEYDGDNTKEAGEDYLSTTVDGLSDTDVGTPAPGHLLIWDATGNWVNRSISGDATITEAGVVAVNSTKCAAGEYLDGDGTCAAASAGVVDATYWVSSADATLTDEVVIDSIDTLNATLGIDTVSVTVSGGKFYAKLMPTDGTITINWIELTCVGNGCTTTTDDLFVNFSTSGTAYVPAGYDGYDDASTYDAPTGWGWDTATTSTERGSPYGGDRWGGLVYSSATREWEADLTDGDYTVRIGSGDPHYNQLTTHRIDVSGDGTNYVTAISYSNSLGGSTHWHTGSADQTVLVDSGETWAVNELVGRMILNLDDRTGVVADEGIIVANTADTITARLTNGGYFDWDLNDNYAVGQVGVVDSSSAQTFSVNGQCLLSASEPTCGPSSEGQCWIDTTDPPREQYRCLNSSNGYLWIFEMGTL